jgi:hypothetical protein
MRNEQEFDALLREALGRGGHPAPFPVDVADCVMARIGQLHRSRDARFDVRQFVAWAVAASVGGAALVSAAVSQRLTLPEAGFRAGHTVAGATDAVLKFSAPTHALLDAAGRVGLALLASAQAIVRPLMPFQPVAHLTLAAVVIVMFCITGLVVGRDVRARVVRKEHA